MVRTFLHFGLSAILCLFTATGLLAQTTVSGVVYDETGEGMIGASVVVKGTVSGTVTDFDGSFELSTNEEPPFILEVTYVGYKPIEVEVAGSGAIADVNMEVEGVTGTEVVVSASRKPETILESPVSIERLDAREIKNTASANFYDAIENLKGVQLGTNSLTFKAVNTRGFASFANTRFVQLIDGMDNAAPGLNFPAGNLVGISELDVNSVELVPGAASALYGPNAFNGILLMTSKDPFYQQGLSVMVKGGVTQQSMESATEHFASAGTNPFGEIGIRYAKAFNDKFAMKFNFSSLQGTDWWATDRRDINGVGLDSPSYDGMNVYGDDFTIGLDLTNLATGETTNTLVTRTGYDEIDLVDDGFDATSYKFDAGLYYKIGNNAKLIYNYRFGSGQSVYQGTNRYRLRGITLQQHKIELQGSNYFLRGYTTQENAGDSYDTKFMAFNINRAWKSDIAWYTDYLLAYNGILLNPAWASVMAPLGLPTPNNHEEARAFADNNILNNSNLDAAQLGVMNTIAGVLGLPGWFRDDDARYLPGTAEFERARETISYRADLATGSKFIDRTKMYHAEGMYNIAPHINDFMDVQIGGNFRRYILDSGGTIFNDGPNGFKETIPINEFGAYVQVSKAFLEDDRLKISASARYDKNENFDGTLSPRASVVYSMGDRKQHNLRASYQSGFRNPDTQPQFIALDLGGLILLGTTQANMENYSVDRPYGVGQTATILGTDVRDDSYTLSSVRAFAATGDPSVLQRAVVEYVKPERVRVYEIGYKGLPIDKLFLDVSAYLNDYTDFQAPLQVATPYLGSTGDLTGVDDIVNNRFAVFQLYSNATAGVTSYGVGLNTEYSLPRKFKVNANYSFADLKFDEDADPDILPGFNTAKHRFKVGFGNSDVWKGLGFNLSYRYSTGYDWQASFANGYVEPYGVIDAQVSARVPQIKSIVKLGVANLLNDAYQTAPGASFVGRQIYLGITYDELFR